MTRHLAPAHGNHDRRTVVASRRGSRPKVTAGADALPRPQDQSEPSIFWAAALGVLAAAAVFAPGLALPYGTALGLLAVAVRLSPGTRPSAATIFLSLFTANVCLSWFWAADPDAAAVAAISHVGVFTIFLAVRAVVTDRTRFLLIAGGYLFGCLWTVRQISQTNPGAVFALQFADRRFGAPGLNFNYAAYAFVGGILLISVVCWTPNRRLLLRVMGGALALPLVWGIAMSGTRGAAIACACLGLWLVACRVLEVRRAYTVLLIIVAIAAGGTLMGALDPVLRYLDGLWSRSTGDLAGRLTLWPRARHQISEHPLWGLGTGNFAATDTSGRFTHNLFLEITAGLGIIGLVLLCLFLGAAFRVTPTDPPERLVILGCFVAALHPDLSLRCVGVVARWLDRPRPLHPGARPRGRHHRWASAGE